MNTIAAYLTLDNPVYLDTLAFLAALAPLTALAILASLACLDASATLKRSRFRNAGHSGEVRTHQVHSGTL